MSSVTRFLRQIPVSTTYYSAQPLGTTLDENTTNWPFYQFQPSSSNYVGNYPTGYNNPTGGIVTQITNANTPEMVLALQEAYDAASTGNYALILRDMGKTIFAPQSLTANANWGYFRQVQLLGVGPQAITQGPGFMGGINGNTFGVLGAANTPDVNTDYMTFYIPVTIGGVGVLGGQGSIFVPIAGGQM
jgi:hypothetical protein